MEAVLSFLWKAKRDYQSRPQCQYHVHCCQVFVLGVFPGFGSVSLIGRRPNFTHSIWLGALDASLSILCSRRLGRDVGFESLGMSKYVAVALLIMSRFFGGSGCAEANSTKGTSPLPICPSGPVHQCCQSIFIVLCTRPTTSSDPSPRPRKVILVASDN